MPTLALASARLGRAMDPSSAATAPTPAPEEERTPLPPAEDDEQAGLLQAYRQPPPATRSSFYGTLEMYDADAAGGDDGELVDGSTNRSTY